MRLLFRITLIGVVAGVALCFWLWPRSASQTSGGKASDAARIPVLVPALSSPALPAVQVAPMVHQESTKPGNDKLVLIHSNLAKWFEAKRNGAEEDAEPLINELKWILTDTNASEITESLSAEEQNSPFGLAALGRWMEVDPVKASTWIAAIPAATQDQVWVAARGWMDDPVGLQQYIDQLPNNAWKQRLLAEASSEALTRDSESAVNFAQQMSPGSTRTDLLQATAGHWIERDPNAALNWIAKIDDSALRDQLVASAAKSYALPGSIDPEAKQAPGGADR